MAKEFTNEDGDRVRYGNPSKEENAAGEAKDERDNGKVFKMEWLY